MTASSYSRSFRDIPGTTIFDAQMARLGYHLNMFCMSLMDAENRNAFKADPQAYLRRYPMTEAQRDGVLRRDYAALVELGGNVFYLVKLVATDGLPVVAMVAQMTGVSQAEHMEMMLAGGRPPTGAGRVGKAGGR